MTKTSLRKQVMDLLIEVETLEATVASQAQEIKKLRADLKADSNEAE